MSLRMLNLHIPMANKYLMVSLLGFQKVQQLRLLDQVVEANLH